MKKLLLSFKSIGILIIAFHLCVLSAFSQENQSKIRKDINEKIKILNKDMEKAFNDNDMVKVAAFYRDDAEISGEYYTVKGRDERFIPMYELKLIDGRNFSKDIISDLGQTYIVNESMAKEMGWSNPIGKELGFGSPTNPMGKIVGVIKDFHFSSLKNKIEPMLLSYRAPFKEISIKIEQGNIPGTIENIKSSWEEIVTDRPFEYSFLDEHFSNIYKTELQLSRVTNIAAGLSIFIACLGILGLISIIIQQRVKEIGIRKILGASVGNIIFLFSKGVLQLVFIALMIAFPIAWLAMNNWLHDFAYRINIGWWAFAVAGVAALLIALLTVSFQAMKAALANPVKNLRTE
jgi:putative ABC transport system permease protein